MLDVALTSSRQSGSPLTAPLPMSPERFGSLSGQVLRTELLPTCLDVYDLAVDPTAGSNRPVTSTSHSGRVSRRR